MSASVLLIALCFLAAAALYASVGHAGASGYLAVLALFGTEPALMRPTALLLNIVVGLIAWFKFYRAGHFSWRLFWPFALGSVPAAFIGGRMALATGPYGMLVGAVLLYSSWRMFFAARSPAAPGDPQPPRIELAVGAGVGIGLLSGLTGVGGGIFLSPLLLILGWASFRETAGVAALFILANSASGLLGLMSGAVSVPPAILLWAPAVAIGGWIGAEYGSRRLSTPVLRQLLSLVLVVAGLKLMLS